MPQTNPFETPMAQPMDPSARRASGTGTFDIGQCMSEAWKATWANFPLWLGVMFVGGIVGFLGAVTVIGLFLVLPVLGYGLILFTLNMHDGKATFNDMFAGFSKYGQALMSMLGLWLCFFGLYMVGNSVQLVGGLTESSVLAGLGVLVSLAWGLGVMIRFYFAPFFIVDQGMGAIDALKASWAATEPQKLALIGLAILSGIVAMAGILAFIIGVLATSTMSYLMFASAYRQLTGTYRG